jgi:GH25 family lysozyme M1 (1,4-beta-N-acetylmuramidase)
MHVLRSCLILSIALTLSAISDRAHAVVQGIDVSHFQGNINWNSVKADGIEFAFVKATEGVDFIDVKFNAYMNDALSANVLIGPYHFARPDSFKTDPLDAANEANDFVDAIQPYYLSGASVLRPVIDMERTSGQPTLAAEKQFLSQWIRNFAAVVQTRLGVSPIIYSSSAFASNVFDDDLNQFPLWIAKPTTTNDFAFAAPPTTPQLGIWGNTGYSFWQWSWTGIVGGINPVDRDVFAGSLQDLRSQFAVPEPCTIGLALCSAAVCVSFARVRR